MILIRRTMMATLLLAGCYLSGSLLLAQVPATQPAAKPDARLPHTLADIVTFSVVNGQVVAEVHWKPQGEIKLSLQDLPGETMVQAAEGVGRAADGPQPVLYIGNARGTEKSSPNCRITVMPKQIGINYMSSKAGAAGVAEGGIWSLTLTPNGVSFGGIKMAKGRMEEVKQINELSWADLLDKHPDQVEADLRPMLEFVHLESLLAAPDLWVYQVLADQLKPKPDDEAQVKKLVEQLDDPAPEKRDEAIGKLKKLGNPALAVLVRLDRSQLTPEQAARIASLAKDGFLEAAQVTAFKTDTAFLLTCLQSREEVIRRAGTEQLQTVLGKKVDFDPAGTIAQRAEQVHKLRQQLLPSTQPATTKPM